MRHSTKKFSEKRSAKGEPLHKRVTVKIIPPDDTKPYKWYWRAPAGQFYSPANIDEILEKVVEHLENKFPQWEFRLVTLGPNAFHFIYVGDKDASTVDGPSHILEHVGRKSEASDSGKSQ